MKPAYAKDDAFLADVAQPASSPDELRIWWLGQSGFLVRHGGSLLLLDPYLSDSLTKKYDGTDKPHVRMTERVIAPERLTGISVTTSSHNHSDHLDAETLNPLRAANPQMQFVIPEANRAFVASRLGCEETWPVGLDDGTSAVVAGWHFTGIAAAHNELETDEAGRHRYLGYIIRRGRWTLYHSGDTLLYPGLSDKLADFAVDIAFVPINGNRPERRVAGNLDGREAGQLARDIGARIAVPHHFDMFEFNTADPHDLFIPECEHLGQPYRVLRPGEGISQYPTTEKGGHSLKGRGRNSQEKISPPPAVGGYFGRFPPCSERFHSVVIILCNASHIPSHEHQVPHRRHQFRSLSHGRSAPHGARTSGR
jgi:L-ascorbate metabolism protein UlaG (beta-lactamase superfamily)